MSRSAGKTRLISRPHKKKRSKVSVSKMILFSFILLYYIGFFIATKTVLVDTAQLYTYLTYIGAPVAIVVPFYLNKSKAENTEGGIVYETAMRELDDPTEYNDDIE